MLYAKASLINDRYQYTDPAVQLTAGGSVMQYYQEAGWRQRLSANSKLLVFVPVQLSWLPTGVDSQRQSRVAIASAYSISTLHSRLEASVQARAERINTTNIFLPGAGLSFYAMRWMRLQANAQRTYRMPTLNELYYFPGGNSSLRPEQGWSEDAGYVVHIEKERWTLRQGTSVFNRNIDDWILWLGGAIWTPHNIASVHSRGAETDSRATYSTGNWRFHIAANTSYVLATTTASYLPDDGSPGKQIPYTPRYNLRVNAGFTWKRLYLNYNHSYTGYRFITTDESAWLLPYATGNVQASYTTSVYKHNIHLNAQCSNIWNVQYSVAGFRPMPGINWLAGFRLDIK
jgi:iron complex outermembrane receptor protein